MKHESYRTITIEQSGSAARVTLSRPDVKNAFNDEVIAELTRALSSLGGRDDVRVVVITGEGSAFSAGADLNWMKKMAAYGYEQNLDDARALADMFETLYTLPKPTIARVNGPAIGGGVGLVAACDIAVASREAFFSLCEVRLGLVPACIAPYVTRRVGGKNAREYFLTGTRFDAEHALQIGLVNRVADGSLLDEEVRRWEENFIRSGPRAIESCKRLIARCSTGEIEELKEFTARMIADLRISDEGQEGMAAFFEKRKPSWTKDAG
ncbi:MAG: enoyl-CoA hydratase/isomerase family protein [Chitinivibrionia bacterium]|nr:enoyl-CoA hydratase/isomerase family protein [Chitinivibrionia bacterium]